MVYRIAVCDDAAADRAAICAAARRAVEAAGLTPLFTEFEEAEGLFCALERERSAFDLLLLDILLEGENGVELARRLRRAGVDTGIVLISSSPDFMLEGYDVYALQYVLKPIDPARLAAAVRRDLAARAALPPLRLNTGGGEVLAAQQAILYIESDRRVVRVHLQNGQVHSGYKKLDEVQAQLNAALFVRCHKSYCVGLRHVAEVRRYRAVLCDGTELPVSKARYAPCRAAFETYGL